MSAEQRAKVSASLLARGAGRTHKFCPGCKETLPLTEFADRCRKGRTFPEAYCRDCHREISRARARRYHHADPERAAKRQRRTDLRLRFGITVEDYDRMLAEQGGGCAVCQATTPGSRKRYFAVDHDHTTGQVRALLCIACNTGIGHLGDDPERLRAAAAYIEAHQRAGRP